MKTNQQIAEDAADKCCEIAYDTGGREYRETEMMIEDTILNAINEATAQYKRCHQDDEALIVQRTNEIRALKASRESIRQESLNALAENAKLREEMDNINKECNSLASQHSYECNLNLKLRVALAGAREALERAIDELSAHGYYEDINLKNVPDEEVASAIKIAQQALARIDELTKLP